MQGGWMGRTHNHLEVILSLLFRGNFRCGCPEEMAPKEFSPVPSTQRFSWGKMTTLDLPAYSFSQLLWNFCFHQSKNIFSYLGLAPFSPLAPFGRWRAISGTAIDTDSLFLLCFPGALE